MKLKRYVTTRNVLETEYGDFELSNKPIDWRDPLLEVNLDAKRAIVGYVDDDPFVENPLDDDEGWCQIYTRSRDRGNHDLSAIREALGLDEYDSPDIEQFLDQASQDHLLAFLKDREAKHNGGTTEVVGYDADVYWNYNNNWARGHVLVKHQSGRTTKVYFEMSQSWSDHSVLYRGKTVKYEQDEEVERIALQYWRDGRNNGTVGNPYAIPLDIYEHGNVMYSVAGTHSTEHWDTSRNAALWVPGRECLEHLMTIEDPVARLEKAAELAASSCKVYTDWCNGETYGVFVDAFELVDGAWVNVEDENDACGGYIGLDGAEGYVLKEMMNFSRRWLNGS